MFCKNVRANRCCVSLKLFTHAAQRFYSKTKAGVDGGTKLRAVMQSSNSHIKWEPNMVSQVLKTLAINELIYWRILHRREVLESKNGFNSHKEFRYSLNKFQFTANFLFGASKELIIDAANVQLQGKDDSKDVAERIM